MRECERSGERRAAPRGRRVAAPAEPFAQRTEVACGASLAVTPAAGCQRPSRTAALRPKMAAPAGCGSPAGAQGVTRPPEKNLLSQAQKLASACVVVSAAPHIGGKVAGGGSGVVWPPGGGRGRPAFHFPRSPRVRMPENHFCRLNHLSTTSGADGGGNWALGGMWGCFPLVFPS